MDHGLIRKRIDSICSDIRYNVTRAPDHCWTFEKFMEWRTANVFGRYKYDKLPQWAKSEITGFWNAMFGNYEREYMFWTYLLEGKRILSKLQEDKIDAHPEGWRAVDANDRGCAYVFKAGKRLIIIPFRQEERDADIAAGRLTADDVSFVINRLPYGELVRLQPAYEHRRPMRVPLEKGLPMFSV